MKKVLQAWFMKIRGTYEGIMVIFKKLVPTMPTHFQLISIWNIFVFKQSLLSNSVHNLQHLLWTSICYVSFVDIREIWNWQIYLKKVLYFVY